jgi:hypothetical protein
MQDAEKDKGGNPCNPRKYPEQLPGPKAPILFILNAPKNPAIHGRDVRRSAYLKKSETSVARYIA